ncbi:hypothetical protein B0H34DRAFT_644835 [Crassisporium funariophilum]|nr:hypothetical protein B0H34DRAFT_644835 [Crassisporium funariophilum]
MTFCAPCQRSFVSWSAYDQHRRKSSFHEFCSACDVDFDTFTGLKEHWVQSPRHAYCQHCSQHFNDRSELEEHYHDHHSYCGPCNKIFVNDYGLQEHYRQSPLHHYCESCKRMFQSFSNLQAHLNSSIHRPKDVVCPFNGCDMKFVSRSALVLHLEGGGCRSGMDRATINKYYATEASWNGRGFECYLCHNPYTSLRGLNQHLGSPRHQGRIYVCPASDCRMRFTTLSALCQHIESEKCGVSKFKAVQNTMDSFLGQMGRLTYYN